MNTTKEKNPLALMFGDMIASQLKSMPTELKNSLTPSLKKDIVTIVDSIEKIFGLNAGKLDKIKSELTITEPKVEGNKKMTQQYHDHTMNLLTTIQKECKEYGVNFICSFADIDNKGHQLIMSCKDVFVLNHLDSLSKSIS